MHNKQGGLSYQLMGGKAKLSPTKLSSSCFDSIEFKILTLGALCPNDLVSHHDLGAQFGPELEALN